MKVLVVLVSLDVKVFFTSKDITASFFHQKLCLQSRYLPFQIKKVSTVTILSAQSLLSGMLSGLHTRFLSAWFRVLTIKKWSSDFRGFSTVERIQGRVVSLFSIDF